MSTPVIQVENLHKYYRLGQIGGGTLREDLGRWWAKARGRDTARAFGEHGTQDGDDEIWALRGVSFEVHQGEILGIVGRNGAGKSTLLKILARITAPTSGRVRIRGRIGSLLEVGTGFHPELTGRENVYLNAAILGMRKAEVDRKFEEIVEFAEMARFIDTPVKRYSTGMYVRLAFAVPAHLEPEVLIIDEVLAVGDAMFQNKCIAKMQDVSTHGRTVLFVSHNMGVISKLCSTSVLLKAGKLEAAGPTDAVLRTYLAAQSSETAEVSLAAVTSRRGNGTYRFEWIAVQNEKQELCHSFFIGNDVRISFGLRNVSAIEPDQLTCAVALRNSDGIQVCNMINWDSDFSIPAFRNELKLSLTIVDIRLYPDTYYISIWAGSKKGEGHVVYDNVVDCLTFQILRDSPMTERPLVKSQGVFFLTPPWDSSF